MRAILGVRSRVFQEMLYGITTVFGSPQVIMVIIIMIMLMMIMMMVMAQVPVAELLARPVPTLHSPSVGAGRKSSNFLQVPEIEAPRPKSVILNSTFTTFERHLTRLL